MQEVLSMKANSPRVYDALTFKEYDAENPNIWDKFEYFAMVASTHRSTYSARAVFHRIRWETMISGGKDFKVNNNWSQEYAKKFMRLHPELPNFFKVRERSWQK